MMTTYSKNKVNSLRYPYAGSLSDRLQLIDTTPTGEDPYQIGEAEMREQSPIPRLVLPKNNRVRIHTGEGFGSVASPATSVTASTRRIYDPEPEPKPKKRKKASNLKTNRRKSSSSQIPTTTSTMTTMSSTIRTSTSTDLDLTVIKKDLDWEPFSKKPRQTSLVDFSYGETSLNLASSASVASSGELVSSGRQLPTATLVSSNMDLYSSCKLEKMDIATMSFNDIFEPEPPGDEDVQVTETTFETEAAELRTNRRARTASLAGSPTAGEVCMTHSYYQPIMFPLALGYARA